jgi:hypothetical protein
VNRFRTIGSEDADHDGAQKCECEARNDGIEGHRKGHDRPSQEGENLFNRGHDTSEIVAAPQQDSISAAGPAWNRSTARAGIRHAGMRRP